MKKRLFLMAMVGVSLTGCVNDEVADVVKEQQKVKIAFDSPITYNNTSRANYNGEIGGTSSINGTSVNQILPYPTAENFVVFAVKHKGNFVNWNNTNGGIFMGKPTTPTEDNPNEMESGVVVKYDATYNGWRPIDEEGTWKDYYWPGGEHKVTFAAYSPADLIAYQNTGNSSTKEVGASDPTVTYGSNGLHITDFETAKNIKAQFDLMFSDRTYDQTVNGTNGGYEGVPLKFNHALSSIKFKLQSTSDQTVVLNSLSIINIRSKGDFKESISENTTTPGNSTKTPGWINLEKPKDYDVNTESGATIDFKTGTFNHEDVLLIPQSLAEYTSNSTTVAPSLHVVFTVGSTRHEKTIPLNGLAIQATDTNSGASTAATETISEWKMGVRYVYLLHYGDDKILFAPSADGWNSVEVIVVNLNEVSTTEE